jgi:hypothetical protein
MTLYEKIIEIYPQLAFQMDADGKPMSNDFSQYITLQNDSDGKGDYIAKWEHPTLAKPTDEELA